MTAEEYIVSIVKALKDPVPIENSDNISLEETIFKKIMSTKFRKLKADSKAIADTQKAIELAVKNQKPVAIDVIFGGNKFWHFDEAPEIDWAELFNAIYYANWLKYIASVYKPGAYLEYYSEDVVLENMNNLPPSETDRYSETFKSMLEWLKPFLPEGVTIGYKRYRDEYKNISEYLAELEEAKIKVLKELGGELPKLSDKQKRAVEINVRLLPGQADDPLWREKVELIHQSIERTETIERYIDNPNYVPACPTIYPGYIATGSTKKSYAKFWVAVGALEKEKDSFTEVVLTPKQLESAVFDWEDVNIEGLKGKNFKKIRVLKSSIL